jgi:putative transposase
MPNYRRVLLPGGTYFFTVVTNQRRPILVEAIARKALRSAFLLVKERLPFQIDAICLLPEHLHCILTLPEQDCDYSTRWKRIKAYFSRQYLGEGGSAGEITASKIKKGEVGVWQRRFWEHIIRDLEDLNRHLDYIHYNPVKHGSVKSVRDWPWSSFHRYVETGFYPPDWGGARERGALDGMEVGE